MSVLPISSLRANTFFIPANLFALALNSLGDVIPVKAGIQRKAPGCSLSQESAFARRLAAHIPVGHRGRLWRSARTYPRLGRFDSQVRNGVITRWVRS